MNPDLARTIRVPQWHRVKPNKRGSPKRWRWAGCDVETVEGFPYTLQLWTVAGGKLYYVNKSTILARFVGWVRRWARPGGCNLIFFFNLSYDLVALLYRQYERFEKDHFTIARGDWSMEIFSNKCWFAKLRFPGRTVWIVDVGQFFRGSLAGAAKACGLDLPKLRRPKGLGKRCLVGEEFEKYALRDAELCYEIGSVLVGVFRRFDVGPCVSIAHLSARVFRHLFLRHPFQRLPGAVEWAALLSYHGGRNGFYCRPGTYQDVVELDVISDYPWAMAQLPSFGRGRFVWAREWSGADGVYLCSGREKGCTYPVAFDHQFRPLRGQFEGVWIAGPELEEALRTGELDLEIIGGWVWKPLSKDLPIERFVHHFFELKEKEEDPVWRYVYKLVLNSLYGKFIQTIEIEEEGDEYRQAGGLYYPFAATLITSRARARLHQLEHEYEALHSSTDSIKTLLPVREMPGLGGLKVKVRGPCCLLRNKVYVHKDAETGAVEFAHHGLPGGLRELEKIVSGASSVTVQRPVPVREALRRGCRPLRFESRTVRFSRPGG